MVGVPHDQMIKREKAWVGSWTGWLCMQVQVIVWTAEYYSLTEKSASKRQWQVEMLPIHYIWRKWMSEKERGGGEGEKEGKGEGERKGIKILKCHWKLDFPFALDCMCMQWQYHLWAEPWPLNWSSTSCGERSGLERGCTQFMGSSD